ncbi:glycosyltransferase family 2 protein [Limnoglobus roseus]|uniref:GT2 family glycosyltransferase n=1 Tax=Limnoglobus roseus TaxID=2598579 RepID=A0A5C1AU95_9BACT|nr:glycosyltransferase family 2 protein [Limnoglobus roseus]QEL20348.1 GT2 family glycosyltransferase [Limnoglobus roseus]
MADDLAWELDVAKRRIEQLEATLMRRTELLEQRQTELHAIKSSKAFRMAHVAQRVMDRLLPLHTKRRSMVKAVTRKLGRLVDPRTKNGPPPEARHLEECTPPAEYQRWIRAFEPSAADLQKQRQHAFPRTPIISLIVPVYNPPAAFLEAMLKSVQEQTYPHWQLCLADASTVPHVRPILEKFATDKRVKLEFLESNGGIVGNSNAALDMASGDFIALLDHDDTLAPFALFEIASAINANPAAEFFYSDEDKLDFSGSRVEPHFKPDWSPETLQSRNYVCHLVTAKRSLIDEIGGFRTGFEGAQDHDLVLRATERARQIVHIPHVLYHWRMHRQSTAADAGSKGYAHEAGKRAVQEHLDRLGIDGTAHDGIVPGLYHVAHHLRSQPLVSVIVPNKDAPEMLARCIDSLAKSSYANFELLIVENGSTRPETFAYYRQLEKQPHVRVVEWTKPFNYAAVNNFAATQARGELLLFLNNDIEAVNPDWLERMVKLGVQPGVGAVGAKLYYADDTIQHAGIVVGMGGVAGHGHLNFPRQAAGYMQRLRFTQNVAAVTGACLLCPTDVFREVGGFDEGFVLAFNDVDLCLQILAKGHRVVWTPHAELYHFESKTRGYEDTPEKLKRFKREHDLFHIKWGHFLKQGDPYYNPHYRLDRADFALRVA